MSGFELAFASVKDLSSSLFEFYFFMLLTKILTVQINHHWHKPVWLWCCFFWRVLLQLYKNTEEEMTLFEMHCEYAFPARSHYMQNNGAHMSHLKKIMWPVISVKYAILRNRSKSLGQCALVDLSIDRDSSITSLVPQMVRVVFIDLKNITDFNWSLYLCAWSKVYRVSMHEGSRKYLPMWDAGSHT